MPARIIHIDRADLRLGPKVWAFAETRREEIDAHFRATQAAKPALWNGRVLLLHDYTVTDGVMFGAFLETDFASFLAWRDWGWPDSSVWNAFAYAALRSADGAFLLGVMGAHTSNAGSVYFPSGTPDPDDVVGDTVDLAGNLRRELAEETGLSTADVTVAGGWTVVFDGPLIAFVGIVRSPEPADVLRANILRSLHKQAEPELADIRIVRSRADFDPAMPGVMTAFLEHTWSGGHS